MNVDAYRLRAVGVASVGGAVVTSRADMDVRVEEGISILDALLDAGVEADYSCTQAGAAPARPR